MKETIEWPIFALKLKQMREAAGFTQKQLAKHSEVGERTLSSFESGARTNAISVAQLMDLTWACGYTVAEFMERKADDFGPSLVVKANRRSVYQRQYRKRQKRSRLGDAVQIIRPKRGITILRSSDLLQSSLGEARR